MLRSLCTLVRAMGKNPTQEELQKIIAQIDPQGEGCVNFDQFMRVSFPAATWCPGRWQSH
jgi:Ca2+-binding EF-hand superfamily protein